jgi:hypothetical protein
MSRYGITGHAKEEEKITSPKTLFGSLFFYDTIDLYRIPYREDKMKKVQVIDQAPATLAPVAKPVKAPKEAPAPAALEAPTLTDSETRILKHLAAGLNQAQIDLRQYVGQILTVRQLDVNEYGISLADCKTIVKNPTPPAAPAPPAPPAAPSV